MLQVCCYSHFIVQETGSEGLMKWPSREERLGFIIDLKPLYLVMSSAPRILGEMSIGASRLSRVSGPSVGGRLLVLKG